MKRVEIFPYQVGLVFRRGNYIQTLLEGKYWLRFGENVRVYKTTEEFIEPCELNILLKDPILAERLEVVEVKDNQIVLQYQNGIFHQVLTPGRYPFWKGIVENEFEYIDLDDLAVPTYVNKKLLQRKELAQYIRVFRINTFEKALLLVDGEFDRQLEPGTHYFWMNEKLLQVMRVDLRQQQLEISGQEVLTKDKAPLRISFFANYKVVDIEKALLENKDFVKQLYINMQLVLRSYIGTLSLDELLAKKESIGKVVNETVKKDLTALGVELISCGIRDVILPGEVKDIMNQVLIAEKKAQANIIMRREETASTRSLLNTAKLMEDNAMLLKLKEMEYVEKIAENISSISLAGGTQVVEQLRQIFIKD